MDVDSSAKGVTRIAAADARTALEWLAQSDRIERGAVFVLSLEAIRERSGARWARRRDDVWGYLARKLNEHLSYQDIHQRIGETEVLIAMTTEEGVAAQAVGMKILEEVLEFFLGAAERVDIRIKSVTRIDGDDLSCTDLDPGTVATAREQPAAAPYRSRVSAEVERERNPIVFTTSGGLKIKVDFALEHIVSLRHGVTAALRIEPTVSLRTTNEVVPPRKFSRLSDEDMAVIDRATLAFGGLFVPEDTHTTPAMILPVSFRTMGGRKGRDALATIPGLTPERVRQCTMLEFVDIDRGTPNGRLVEVTSLVSQLCRGVLARLHLARDAMDPVHGVRFNGLSVDFADYPLSDERLESLMRPMAHLMRGKAPALIAQGLAKGGHLQMADAAGFTHAGLRAEPMTSAKADVA